MKTSWKVLSVILAVTLIFSLGFLSGQREKVMVTLDDIKRAVEDLGNVIQGAIASGKINPKQIVTVQGLSDINTSLGTIRAGDFLAMSSGTEPTAADGTGTFMSALGRMFGSKTYHIGGVKDGDLKWGANAITGELEAGDGAGLITENGLSIFNGATEIGRFGNLNGFLDYTTDIYGMAMGDADQYMTYDQTNGLRVYGALISEREILTENRTYYVATTGDDANDGLTVGDPFLTPQHAIDVASTTLDIRGYGVVIQLADGEYPLTTYLTLKDMQGTGQVHILGNETTRANVIISGSTLLASDLNTTYEFRGMKLSPGVASDAIYASGVSTRVRIGNIDFDDALSHIVATNRARIEVIQGYEITGSASNFHFSALDGGVINCGTAVTVTGTPSFSAFVSAASHSRINVSGGSFTGAATGKRYQVALLGLITGTSASATFFPGNSAGTTATGGIYD